ncbi:MAG TPA: PAS domain-containing protein [Rhizomicrobium sp.]|nr:PAS domain-containing protein [Rhizomicrobium sp.]
MPRRPGETGGDGDKIKAGGNSGAAPAPPQLLGYHIHAGSPARAPLHPRLKDLLALWSARRLARPMPSREDLPARALKPWEGYFALLAPEPGALRFRLMGAQLVPRLGKAMSGRTLAELDEALRRPLLALADLAVARQAPAAGATALRTDGLRTLWSDLMLPLSVRRAQPPLFIFASYPVLPRPALP